MTTTVLLTELEAVNLMLSGIGEAPVNSIDSSVLSDTSTAKKDLDNACRRVQQRGWSFNTEYELTLTPDIYFNKIILPSNTLTVDAADVTNDYVMRGGLLYDRRLQKFTFTGPVKVNLTSIYSFPDLPYHAQQYALMMAATSFQRGYLDGDSGKFTPQDLMESRMAFNAVEAINEDCNILRDDPGVQDTLRRW